MRSDNSKDQAYDLHHFHYCKLISDTWCTVDSSIVMLEETTHQNRKVSSKSKGCQNTSPGGCKPCQQDVCIPLQQSGLFYSLGASLMHSPLIKSMKMTHLTVPVFYPHISKLCLIICNEGFKHSNLFRISLTYSFNCWTVLLICQLFVNPCLQYVLFSSTVVNFHCTIQMSLYVCIDVSAKRKSTRRSTGV